MCVYIYTYIHVYIQIYISTHTQQLYCYVLYFCDPSLLFCGSPDCMLPVNAELRAPFFLELEPGVNKIPGTCAEGPCECML